MINFLGFVLGGFLYLTFASACAWYYRAEIFQWICNELDRRWT